MSRLLLCLALCLLFALLYGPARRGEEADRPTESAPVEAPRPQGLAALLGNPGGDCPAPVAFLEKCLERYDATVKGYTVTMQKRERVGGFLYLPEVVDVWFREEPFSVLMKWRKGARQAKAAQYVAGQNKNHILVIPAGFLALAGVIERPLDDREVKQSGRFGIDEFGMKKGCQRVLEGWNQARARKALHVVYQGVFRLAEAGDRPCYKLHRTDYDRPDEDGITDLVLYVDTETLLQVGTVLHAADGRLIGEYFFRDVRLNPTFPADQFTRTALQR
jgi:hypothetical protein